MSGYIKPIYEEDASPNNGIATHDLGPLNEWFVTGFDGGDKILIGTSTPYALYILMESSDEYSGIFKLFQRKTTLLKMIIEFLVAHDLEEPTYEDFLTELQKRGDPELNEEFLLQHAQFISHQV